MTERRFRRHPGVLWLDTLRGVVILPPGADDVEMISAPGEIVWRLLAEPVTLSDLAQRVGEIFDAPIEQLRADLERLVRHLGVLGAIEHLDP